MNFNEYQYDATKTNICMDKFKKQFPSLPENVYKVVGLSYTGLGLGESGEVQGKIKKIIRDNGGIITEEHEKKILDELGDILWYIAMTCETLGYEMDDIAINNINKLHRRQQKGTLEGSGDDR
jgi:NTP pyrophosphatase (non-canonical NTP hydrolase)